MKWKDRRTILIGVFVSLPICLAAYLLVMFVRHGQDKRDQVTCQGNLRRIGQAMQMYIADNDGFLPDKDLWFEKVIPSLPRSGCPAAEIVPRLDPPLAGAGHGLTGYAFNVKLTGEAIRIDGRLSRVPIAYAALMHPQTTLVVFDYTSGIPTTTVLDGYGNRYGGWPRQLKQGWKRHDGGGNYLFCDGHVEWLTEDRVLPNEGDICRSSTTQPNFCPK